MTEQEPDLMHAGAEAAAEITVVTRRGRELPAAHGSRMAARLRDPRLATPVLVALGLAAIAIVELALRAASSPDGVPEIQAVAVACAIVVCLLMGAVFFFLRAAVATEAIERLAAQLRESEQHRDEGQRLAGIGSWEWDFENHTYLCSEEQVRLHGWDDPDAMHTVDSLLAAIDPSDRERVRSEIVRVFDPGETISLDYQVPRPGGTRLIHLEAQVVERRGGAPSGLVGTCQDVTERLRRLEAERSNRAKSEFMSHMSHELRTPLNAILGFAQLLKTRDADELRRVRNVERILGAGEHLLELIDELLEISRADGGRLELVREESLLNALLAEALEHVRPEAVTRAIDVRSDFGSEEVWAEVDPQRLTQVVVRLLSNAVRYNHEGGHVDLRLAASGLGASVVVADDGPGIPAEKFGQLFEPFQRPGAERTDVQGAGLGLALSERIVEAMGGTIELESDERGTTVTILLGRRNPDRAAPVAVLADASADSERPASAPPASAAPAGSDHRHVVLCIDDNPSNLILIEHVLSSRPAIELLSAERGHQGLELAGAREPQLILLDLNLPDIDGRELLAELKTDVRTREIPVVVVSADSAPEHRAALIAAGAADYLTKPIDIAQLLTLVDQMLTVKAGWSP